MICTFRKVFFTLIILLAGLCLYAGTTEEVSTFQELETALNKANVSTVIVKNTISLSDGTNLDGKGKTVQVSTPYLKTDGTINKSRSSYCVFSVQNGSVQICNMTIYGGYNNNNGGGVSVAGNGTLMMDNCTISRSSRALYIGEGGKAVIKNCNFVRNGYIEKYGSDDQSWSGGAILVDKGGLLVIDNCSLSENRCHYAGGAIGVRNDGKLYANNCVISNNFAWCGGGGVGAINSSATIHMMNCTVTGNVSGNKDELSYSGGGLFAQAGYSDNKDNVYLVNSVFAYNYDILYATGTPVSSDITFRQLGGKCKATLNNCAYGTFQKYGDSAPDVSDTSCTNISDSNFASFRNDGLICSTYNNTTLLSDSVTSSAYKHPVLSSVAGNALALYVPLKNLSSGGIVTYIDYSNLSSIKMAYGSSTVSALGECGSVSGNQYQVKTYFEGGVRDSAQIGASASINDSFYTLKLAAVPVNGQVEGLSLYGDSYPEGTRVTISATANDDYYFESWKKGDENYSKVKNLELTMTEDLVLSANFSEMHYHTFEFYADGGTISAKVVCQSDCDYSRYSMEDKRRNINISFVPAVQKVNYTVLPENANVINMNWESEDPTVVSVNNEGVMTPKKKGSTVVKATSVLDSSVFTTCTVFVPFEVN